MASEIFSDHRAKVKETLKSLTNSGVFQKPDRLNEYTVSLSGLQNELERTTQNRLAAAAKKQEREKML